MKYDKAKPVKMAPTYDGMGAPYLCSNGLPAPKEIPKTHNVKGGGAVTKPMKFSKNG